MRQCRTTLVMIVFLVLLSLALTVGIVAAQAPWQDATSTTVDPAPGCCCKTRLPCIVK